MSVFSDDRAAIAAALEGLGVTVHDHLPGRAIPPCLIVLHGSPFVVREPSDPFGSATARFTVWAVAGKGTNEVETDSAEDLTERAAVALTREGFAFDSIDQPVSFDLNGTHFFAIALNVSTPISFTKGA